MGWRTPQPVSKLCDGALWRWGGKRNENLQLRLWNLNICIEKIDVKCWLVETTLVMTSVPSFTWFSMFVYIHTCFCFALIGGNLTAQSTWCHRGILRQNSSSRDMVASSLSFSCPAPRVPQRACSQPRLRTPLQAEAASGVTTAQYSMLTTARYSVVCAKV